LASELAEAIADRDPSDLTSLSDALADPGTLAYGEGVVAKCALLSAELARLRRRANDSLPQLLTLVMESTGFDIELRADPDAHALRKYENVMAFRDLVEDFASLDGESSLRGLLAWLAAADEWGEPARITLPTLPGSVTVMTVHSAKGLEREVVFVPALAKGVFPNDRSRSRWTTNSGEIAHSLRGDSTHAPPDPNWREEVNKKQLDAFDESVKQQVLLEERRLAYVAVTRAKRKLFATGHIWGSRKKPLEPSVFLAELREAVKLGAGRVINWAELPETTATNPLSASPVPVYWPIAPAPEKQARLFESVRLVQEARSNAGEQFLNLEAASSLGKGSSNQLLTLAQEIIAEARLSLDQNRTVLLPATLSVSEVAALSKDPIGFAANLYRPMPTAPSSAGRRGTAFHEWVEDHFQTSALVEPTDLPGAADEGLINDEALEAVKAGFLKSRWAELSPVELEWDFVLPLGGRAIAGRADAVFLIDGHYTVVDWKTGSAEFVDPIQLSLYRHAWAMAKGLDAAVVAAMFVFLPSGDELTPERLLTLEEVGEILGSKS
jgi:DNA helicase-2/ATP-dependent DNA helicase PcrA